MMEGIIGSPDNEKESWAEDLESPKWSAERLEEGKQAFFPFSFFFLSCSRSFVFASFREPRWTALAHLTPWEAAREIWRGGRVRKGFGSERRPGELWPLSGSPWWLLLCLSFFSDVCRSFLSLFFGSRTLFCPADLATDNPHTPKTLMFILQASQKQLFMWGKKKALTVFPVVLYCKVMYS